MPSNLLNLAEGYLSKPILHQISELLEEESSSVTKTLNGALPTILGGIMNLGSTQNGLNALMGHLIEEQHAGILDNLSKVLKDSPKSSDLINGGSEILNTIFGAKKNNVIEAISSFGGLKSSSTTSLLSIIAPVLLRIIGKQVKSNGLGMAGFASLLMGQKDSVKAAMPAELSELATLLNFDKLGEYKGGDIKSSLDGLQKENRDYYKYIKLALPALALLLIFIFLKGCS